MPVIKHKDVNCCNCSSYKLCFEAEERFHTELVLHEGNWRELRHPDGRRVGTPIRRCSQAIFKKWSHLFDDANVLEIGCGPFPEITDEFCSVHNTKYVGIDPSRLPPYEIDWLPLKNFQRWLFSHFLRFGLIKTSRFRRFVHDLFPSKQLAGETFDVIYGTSALEHWHEDIDNRDSTIQAYSSDIKECWRLLRKGGVLLMDIPIYLHGNIWLMRGDVGLVESMFTDNWKTILFEHWREQHDGLAPYCPERRREAFRRIYDIDLHNIWVLNIVAVK